MSGAATQLSDRWATGWILRGANDGPSGDVSVYRHEPAVVSLPIMQPVMAALIPLRRSEPGGSVSSASSNPRSQYSMWRRAIYCWPGATRLIAPRSS